jgi:hypothetical protein
MQFSFIIFLLVVGCPAPAASERPATATDENGSHNSARYMTIAKRPDDILDRMWASYPHTFEEFHTTWTKQASKAQLDGQRAIELLEIASYADVTCHSTEYPLRVATLDYVEANLRRNDVRDAIKWVLRSYKSHLPLESPNDENDQLRGVLVESMNIRMVEYADELLNPKVPSQHRK